MNILKRLINNFKNRSYSSTKLLHRSLSGDYAYLKKALTRAPNYLKVQAADYLSKFDNQENLDFLITEFKSTEDLKLKAYIFNRY